MSYLTTVQIRHNKASIAFRGRVYRRVLGKKKYLKSKTFSTRTDAQEWANQLAADKNGQPYSTLTLCNLVDRYILSWEGTPKNTSRSRSSLNVIKDHPISNKKLTDLTAFDFVEFGKWLSKRGLKPSTIAGHMSAVSTCFDNANTLIVGLPTLNNGIILEARKALNKLGLIKNSTPSAKPIEPEQLQLVRQELKTSPIVKKHRSFLIQVNNVLECTGIRESSLDRLIEGDFNKRRKTLFLRNLKSPNGDNYNKTVQLTPDGVKAIEALGLNDQPYKEQMPISWSMIRKYFRRLFDSIGLEDAVLKDYRSAFITSLLDDGASLNGVATYTGHKDIHTIAAFYDGTNALIRRTRKIVARKRFLRKFLLQLSTPLTSLNSFSEVLSACWRSKTKHLSWFGAIVNRLSQTTNQRTTPKT